MSLQPREPSSAHDNSTTDANRAQGLKVWSCVNCRRRKVRCDRRYPCAPCSKNEAECVFPVSGRVPRRSRDLNNPASPAHKQAELVGRLRRLEAMVGDLSSQVENSAGVSQGNESAEDSMSTPSASSAMTSKTGWSKHQEFHSQPSSEHPFITHGEVRSGSGMVRGDLELSQASDDSGVLNIASNGDVVVGNRLHFAFLKQGQSI